MMFKIGMIGCGHMASEYHGPALARYAARHPQTQLVACCDIEQPRAEQFGKRFGFAHWETDIQTMLSRHTPDAVCLVVPEHLTCELSCQIAARGFPLFLEKPPGLTVEQIDRMIRATEAAGVHVDVGFNRRHMPLIRRLLVQLREVLPAAAIHHIQYEMIRWNRADPDFSRTAIHGIDLVQFLAGSDYRQVDCTYQALPQLGATVANIQLSCRMQTGATAQMSFCPMAGAVVERISVHGQDHSFYVELPMWDSLDAPGRLQHVHCGKVICDLSGTEIATAGGNGDSHATPAEVYGFYNENADFLEHVRGGKPAQKTLRTARQAVAIAQAIRDRKNCYIANGDLAKAAEPSPQPSP